MRSHDRAFLEDICRSTCVSHTCTALLLQKALKGPDAKAVSQAAVAHPFEGIEAVQPLIPRDEVEAVFERAIVFKLFVELTAAYEDNAALGLAIRERESNGLGFRYFHRGPLDAHAFYHSVRVHQLSEGTDGLSEVLEVPKPETLKRKLSTARFANLAHAYHQAAYWLDFVAHRFGEWQGRTTSTPAGDYTSHASDVTIITDVFSKDDMPSLLGDSRHRPSKTVLLGESASSYSHSDGENEVAKYIVITTESDSIDEIIEDISHATRCNAHLANLILQIGQVDLEVLTTDGHL